VTHLCKVLAAPDPNADRDNVAYLVSEMKLYLDLDSGQCAVRLHCSICGKKLTNWCYNSLEDAIFFTVEREEVMCPDCCENEFSEDDDFDPDTLDYPAGHSCNLGVSL